MLRYVLPALAEVVLHHTVECNQVAPSKSFCHLESGLRVVNSRINSTSLQFAITKIGAHVTIDATAETSDLAIGFNFSHTIKIKKVNKRLIK